MSVEATFDKNVLMRLLLCVKIVFALEGVGLKLTPVQLSMMFLWKMCVVVVVVVVYLTTNQRHMGYLSSGNGHLAGRYSTP